MQIITGVQGLHRTSNKISYILEKERVSMPTEQNERLVVTNRVMSAAPLLHKYYKHYKQAQ